jgi:hypothetical protein
MFEFGFIADIYERAGITERAVSLSKLQLPLLLLLELIILHRLGDSKTICGVVYLLKHDHFTV